MQYALYHYFLVQGVPMQIEGQQIQLEDGSHLQLQDGQLHVMTIDNYWIVVCEFVT